MQTSVPRLLSQTNARTSRSSCSTPSSHVLLMRPSSVCSPTMVSPSSNDDVQHATLKPT